MQEVQSPASILSNSLSAVRARWATLPGQQHTGLLARRKEALSSIEKSGLPGRKSEEYKYFPIAAHLEKIALIVQPSSPDPDLPAAIIPNFDGHTLVLTNGHVKSTSPSLKKSGLTITPLAEVGSTRPDELASLIRSSTDPFAQWNQAAWDAGILIEGAPRDGKPLMIAHTNTGAVVNYRVLVLLSPSSELKVVEQFVMTPDRTGFTNLVTQVVVRESAKLTWVSVQDDAAGSHLVNNLTITQQAFSVSDLFTFTLDGALVRNNLTAELDGEKIEAHLNGLYIVNNRTQVDNHTVVDHRYPNSVSNELYKGIMDGESRAVFNGKIYVRPNAQKTNAFQSNRNILLSENAQIHTKPQLEIWADDVKCSHGCTSGQLDDEALFYLTTRGITKREARAMLLDAFAAEVMGRLPFESVREYLRLRITEKLHKVSQ